MKNNLLILEDSSKAHFGGGQKVTLDIMCAFKGKYRLILIDCKKDSIFKKRAQKYTDNLLNICCHGKTSGGKTSSFSVGILEILFMPFLYIKNIFIIVYYLYKNKYTNKNTLAYATTKKTLLLAYMLKKISGINYIFHAHSIDDKRSIFYKLIHPALKSSALIICVSNCVKNNIQLPQCETVYNPITHVNNGAKDITGKKKIIVASFSTLIKLKGIEYFMKSFNHLENKDSIEFWIFGTGEEEKNLRLLEDENIHIKGFSEDTDAIMRNDIDIIIVPSITVEACPLVPLEAFGNGIPVIATNIGGQKEIVKDCQVGYQVPIKNSEAIAKKIDILVKNPQIYKKFSKNALNYAKKFTVENYKRKILQTFTKI